MAEEGSMAREIIVRVPQWVGEVVGTDRRESDAGYMALAIALARENVERGTGGPFGALVVEQASGRIIAAGVNLVVATGNSMLHAEVVALMLAEQAVGSYALGGEGRGGHTLVSSCDPCAMCMGAALWSGVRRIVTGALREDASAVGFDEGPVFAASWRYLERRGIEVVRGVLRDDAREVLALYRERGGEVYNG